MGNKIASIPKETAAELLYFIAENERFSSVSSKLKGNFTVPQVKALIREVAQGLSNETGDDDALESAQSSAELSTKTKSVISSLSAEEEQKLLTTFGLVSE